MYYTSLRVIWMWRYVLQVLGAWLRLHPSGSNRHLCPWCTDRKVFSCPPWYKFHNRKGVVRIDVLDWHVSYCEWGVRLFCPGFWWSGRFIYWWGRSEVRGSLCRGRDYKVPLCRRWTYRNHWNYTSTVAAGPAGCERLISWINNKAGIFNIKVLLQKINE